MKINLLAVVLNAVFAVLCGPSLKAQPAGYGYGMQIAIQATQVSGSADLNNFPVLIYLVDNDLRTVANGGRIQNANGYDIVFTAGNCNTVLDHAIESYSATTGTYRAWVRIPVLSATSNTNVHIYYGNSTVSTDPSTAAVWDTYYDGVWHFNNSLADATSGGNNLTDVSTTNSSPGKISDARSVQNNTNINSSASGQHLVLPDGFFSGYTDFSFEGWVMLDRYQTNWERIFDFGSGTTSNFFLCPTIGTGTPAQTRARITNSGNSNEQGPSINNSTTGTGTWVHWAVVLNSATDVMAVYRNGSLFGSASSVTLTPDSIEPTTANYFGRSQYSADHYFDGFFDEFRISATARSADWIATVYNNQNNPESFISVSDEYTAAGLCSTLPIELLRFEASVKDGKTVELRWTTASETNNDYFSIERSGDEEHWIAIGTVPGQGSSNNAVDYLFIDGDALKRRSNYRLAQTDLDGTITYSGICTVTPPFNNYPEVHPNPASDHVLVRNAMTARLYSPTGELCTVPTKAHPDGEILDVSALPGGVYHLIFATGYGIRHALVVIE